MRRQVGLQESGLHAWCGIVIHGVYELMIMSLLLTAINDFIVGHGME
jgi:hypothetical protein